MAIKKSVLNSVAPLNLDELNRTSSKINYTYGGTITVLHPEIVYHELTAIISFFDSGGNFHLLKTVQRRWGGPLINTIKLTDEELVDVYDGVRTYEPSKTDLNVNYILESFSDSNYQNSLGTSSYDEGYGVFTQEGSYPNFTDFSYEDVNSTTLALTGNNQKIIKGYSNVRYTIDNNNKAVARSGGNITSYEFKNNNGSEVVNTISYPITKTYNAYNKSDLQVKAIDSKGFYKIVAKGNNILDYYLPSGTLYASRKNGTGTSAILSFSGTYWNGNFGSGNNTIKSVSVRRQFKSNGSWSGFGSWFTIPSQYITTSNGTISVEVDTNNIQGLGTIALGNEYEFELKIIDGTSSTAFNTVTGIKATVSSGGVLDSYYKDGNGKYRYGINKLVDTNGEALQIDGNAKNSVSSGDSYYRAERTDTNVKVDLLVGTGGTNHGIYSRKIDKWMVYADASDVWYKKVSYENTNGQTIYPLCSDASGGEHGKLYTTSGLSIWHKQGTTSATGRSELVLGNNIGSGTDGNKDGTIRLFTTGSGSNYIARANNGHGNTRWNYLPDKDGTFAMIEDIFYSSGNTIELGAASSSMYVVNGLVTGGTKSIRLTIITPKRLDNISTITCDSLNVEARTQKGYLNSQDGYVQYKGKSGYTINCYKSSNNAITVWINKSSVYTNVDNNTLVSMNGYFKFTLS